MGGAAVRQALWAAGRPGRRAGRTLPAPTLRAKRRRAPAVGAGLAALAAAAIALGGCHDSSSKVAVTPDQFDPVLSQAIADAGVTPLPPPPIEDPALVALGRALFFDKVLSGNKNISCASCHQAGAFLGDALPVAAGQGASGAAPNRQVNGAPLIARNAPALFNVGAIEQATMFFGGRVARDQQTGMLAIDDALPTSILNVAIQSPPQSEAAAVALELTTALAAQATHPVLDRKEMRGEVGDIAIDGTPNELAEVPDDDPLEVWSRIMARLVGRFDTGTATFTPPGIEAYRDLFEAAFPGVVAADEDFNDLNFGHAAHAIAAYQRTVFASARSPFDRYLLGELDALDEQQKLGGLLFFGRTRKGRCANCHNGPLLTDFKFHAIATPQVGPGRGGALEVPDDRGRGLLANASPGDDYAFRTLALRNVELTGPYMHDGAFRTLREVIVHYDDVVTSLETYDPARFLPPGFQALHDDDPARVAARRDAALSDALLPPVLGLTDSEVDALVAFLQSLTDPFVEQSFPNGAPATVPSGLTVAE